MAIQKVGVLGCGLMGSGIAQVSAQAGFPTVVREVSANALEKGLGAIHKFLQAGVDKGKVPPYELDKVKKNLTGTVKLEDLAASRPTATGAAEGPAPFFTIRSGARVQQHALEDRFRRICELAGVRRSDGARYQPRLHDLRHTFAVHRLTSWYRQGADVQRLLPQLSVYLGHVYLSSTQVYLSMTPELLQEAGARFEKYARKENDDGR